MKACERFRSRSWTPEKITKMKVKFKRYCSDARVPENATPGSACYDVFFARNVILEPNATKSVETDIGLKFSEKYACSF